MLPVDDPFWKEHRPGDRWNCKCELRATDKDCTARPHGTEKDNPQSGLENNPGKDGHLFSDKHPYYPDSCAACQFSGNRLMALFHDLAGSKKHCNSCRKVEKVVKESTREEKLRRKRIDENRKLYDKLSKDSRYKDVEFDPETGGVKATHRGHNEGEDVGFVRERKLVDKLFSDGHSVILLDEQKKDRNANYLRSLDMMLDGVRMDIASITKNKDFYGSVLMHKNHQLYDFNNRSDVHEPADTLCVYFDDPSMFSPEKITKGYEYMKNKTGLPICIRHIICAVNSAKGLELKNFDF